MNRNTSLRAVRNSTGGYIALVTVLILSTILIITSVNAGQSAYISSAISRARSDHQTARLRADDCVRAGLFSFARDSVSEVSYPYPVSISLSPEYTCGIYKISESLGRVHIVSGGSHGNALVNVSADTLLDSSLHTVTVHVQSWFESTK